MGNVDKERLTPVTVRDTAIDLAAYAKGRVGRATLFGLGVADLQKAAQACAKATGVEFHYHRCRHTFATELLRRGVPIDVVQEALGHACIENYPGLCPNGTRRPDGFGRSHREWRRH